MEESGRNPQRRTKFKGEACVNFKNQSFDQREASKRPTPHHKYVNILIKIYINAYPE